MSCQGKGISLRCYLQRVQAGLLSISLMFQLVLAWFDINTKLDNLACGILCFPIVHDKVGFHCTMLDCP